MWTLLVALLFSILPAAQAMDAARHSQPLSRTVEKWQDKRVSALIGARAVDRRGQSLGRIEDLIIASHTGALHFAVVSFGGLLGLGERLYLYPVQALAPGRAPDEVSIEVDRKDLGARTGVAELESWLRQYDPNANIADRTYLQASELLGKSLIDGGGERIGEVEDLVVNLGSGRMRFVVVELSEPDPAGERMRTLPLDALNVPLLTERPLVLRR